MNVTERTRAKWLVVMGTLGVAMAAIYVVQVSGAGEHDRREIAVVRALAWLGLGALPWMMPPHPLQRLGRIVSTLAVVMALGLLGWEVVRATRAAV